MIIYHVARRTEWEAAVAAGVYRAASLATEGFVHCSECRQVPWVLERHFPSVADLVVLAIETRRLGAPVRFERAPDIDDRFPHVYGPVEVAAVVASVPLS